MAADYKKIHRLLKILTLIQSGGAWTPKRLASEFDVTERTIFRDLQVLQDIGVPYAFDEEANRYRVRRDFFMPPVQMTLDESLALVALGEHVAGREQIPMMRAAARAIAKIRGLLPDAIREELEELDRHITIDLAQAGPHEGIGDVYDRVREAIARKRVLTCRYESIRSTLEPGTADDEPFEFRPYGLFFSQRAWYAVGHHGGRDAIRNLKLNRFTGVTLTDRPYAIPDDFDLREHLGNAWRMIRGEVTYDVVLRFAPEFAETVSDTQWHPTQQVEWHDDGSVTLRFRVDGLDEIKWWVLSMGPNCTVVEPPELREQVGALVSAMAHAQEERE